MPEEEEFKMVPIGPIKRLERRIKKLEQEKEAVGVRSLMRDLTELIKTNQSLINEIVKADDKLRDELKKIPGKLDKSLEKWGEFLSVLEEASKAPGEGKLGKKLDKLADQQSEIIDKLRSVSRRLRIPARKGRKGKLSKPEKKYPRIKIKKG